MATASSSPTARNRPPIEAPPNPSRVTSRPVRPSGTRSAWIDRHALLPSQSARLTRVPSVAYRPVLGPSARMLNNSERPVRLLTCPDRLTGRPSGSRSASAGCRPSNSLADGPRTMADLLATGPGGLRALADAIARADVGSRWPPARRGRAPGACPAARQGRRDRTQLSRARRRGRRRSADGAADLREVAELGRRPGAEIRWDPALDASGRLRGGARRRHRSDGAAGRRRATPSTTSSATPASTTSRPATSSSATASGPAASRSTRSARWARSS